MAKIGLAKVGFDPPRHGRLWPNRVRLVLCVCCVVSRCGVSRVGVGFKVLVWSCSVPPEPPFPRTAPPGTALPKNRPSREPPKISLFFPPLPPQNSFFSSLSGGLLVEFWWCSKRRGAQMCTFKSVWPKSVSTPFRAPTPSGPTFQGPTMPTAPPTRPAHHPTRKPPDPPTHHQPHPHSTPTAHTTNTPPPTKK